MSKSFVLGILVASVTWTISLLLYWNLTQGADDSAGSLAAAAVLHGFSQTSESALESRPVPDDNSIVSSDDGKKHKDSNKDLYLEKLRRMKKEKNRRKISQHLADELRPRKVEILGKIKIHVIFEKIFEMMLNNVFR